MIEWTLLSISILFLIRYGSLLNEYLAFERSEKFQANELLNALTVLIPFKNEEQHLKKLIEHLRNQSFDLRHVQFIFVDDHSTDSSASIAQSALPKFSDAEYLLNELQGKKNAILTGSKHAKHNWILMADADSIPSPNWIKQMANCVSSESLLVAGPVQLNVPTTWYGNLIKNEHAALQQLTRLSIAKQEPLMANGANMLFKKELVKKAFNQNNLSYASGDDSNLLFTAWKQNSKSIKFSNSAESTVLTNSPSTLSASIQQRVRWASKLKKYESVHHVTRVGWIIAITNLMIPILGVLSINNIDLGLALVGYLLLKTWIDKRFIQSQLEKHTFLNQFISTLMYPFFFAVILLLSILNAPKKSAIHSQKW